MNRLGSMIAIVCLAGCTGSGGSDEGRAVRRATDSGTIPPRGDSGALQARDGGVAGARDGGAAGARDGGALAAGDSGAGSGPVGDPTTGCATDIVATPSGGACAAATRSCIDACTDAACFETCIARDPGMGDCLDCLDDAYISCANAAGCQSQWDALTCCVDGCADPGSEACYTTTCATQGTAYETCALSHEDTCATSDMVCFAG